MEVDMVLQRVLLLFRYHRFGPEHPIPSRFVVFWCFVEYRVVSIARMAQTMVRHVMIMMTMIISSCGTCALLFLYTSISTSNLLLKLHKKMDPFFVTMDSTTTVPRCEESNASPLSQ